MEFIILVAVISVFIIVTTHKGMFRQSRVGCNHINVVPIAGSDKVQCYCLLIKSTGNLCTYKTCPIIDS